MHPNPDFEWRDRDAMLAFLESTSFTTFCIALPSGPCMVHAPVAVVAPTRLRFHLARRNAAANAEAGTIAAFSCLGPHAYVSPDWYGTSDNVPTWDYVAVEGKGALKPLDETELVDLLDRLSMAHEARLRPKPAWTRARMAPGRFEARLRAIIGFELEIEALHGTRKLSQNKSIDERAGVVEQLRGLGDTAMADLIEGRE